MANFNAFISHITAAEGGYQKIPSDPGNYNSRGELVGTNHGISAKTFERVYGYPPSKQDMLNITETEALNIFKRLYWNKIKGDYINSQAVAETFADHAINSGVGTAVKLMQYALQALGYNVTADGIMGNQTLNAINSADAGKLFREYNDRRRIYYSGLKNFSRWGRIWFNRIRDLERKHLPFLYKHNGFVVLFFLLFGLTLFFIKYKR